MGVDSTVSSFPTYAELTQTQAWSGTAPASPAMGEGAPITSPRYTEGAVLGVGGMGKVVLARDARIGRDVAVKVLHGERDLDPEDRARFLREARVQGQLEHPSIVPVYDIDQRPDGSTFFTMRRVLGRTLGAILDDLRAAVPAAQARYTQRELLTAFATVCLTLDYAHSRGVIHRDLKPANIMLGDFGEVYVLDWGLARLVGSVEPAEPASAPAARLSTPGDMMGTPLYMAPEQMSDPDVGATADVWSLGAILFEILTLQRARDARALFAPVDARPSTRAAELRIAPELEMICVKATEHDPADRYASPRALHDALVRYLEGDRELERRRELSGQYAAEATAALDRAEATESEVAAEQERTTAIRKLRHALALDPNNIDNIKVLGTLISTPPKKLPRAVKDEMAAQEKQIVATGARYSIFASLAWFAFLPFVLWIGIRPGHAYQAALVLGPAGLAALLSAYGRYRDAFPRGLQLCVIGFTILGGAASTTMFGPLMMVPTLLATFTIVIQAHPNRFMRGMTWLFGCLALIIVSLIELAWPSSYLQAGDGLLIVPNLHHLPRGPSILLLLSTSLGMTIVPCLFIGRIRQALNDAQRQILVQAWQFRRFGEDLITTQTRP